MKTIEQWEAEANALIGRLLDAHEAWLIAVDSEGEMQPHIAAANEARAALSAHLATHPGRQGEDAKDAARYRWLRNECEKHRGLTIAQGGWLSLEPWSGDDPDRAIDAAMALPKEPTHD